MKNHQSLLVLAAGLGSRYQGQKQIDPISNTKETLMEFALYDALQVGIQKFVFVINDQMPEVYKKHLEEILKKKGGEVHFVKQTLDKYIPQEFLKKTTGRIKPLGTAHAAYCTKEVIKEPFITINADDFYGRETFRVAYDWLQKDYLSENHYGMLAFQLGKTLSDYGTVSRGICEIEEGLIAHVEEFEKITRTDNSLEGKNSEGELMKLNENDQVSMNFWLLHPGFFKLIEQEMVGFLEKIEESSKEEFYLPYVVNQGIRNKTVEVSALPTSAQWFGLTYPEDKEIAVGEVMKRKEKGVYPDNLWE